MEKEIKKSSLKVSENGLEKPVSSKRLEVLKTYKIYIGGQFPRTESGRSFAYPAADGAASVAMARHFPLTPI